MSITINVSRISEDAKVPVRNHPDDAGLDLFATEDYEIGPGEIVKVKTGVQIESVGDHGVFHLVMDRSSMGSKGILKLAGVIDIGYRGEILVILTNVNTGSVFRKIANGEPLTHAMLDDYTYRIKKGDKIAQLVTVKIHNNDVSVNQLADNYQWDNTSRGEAGFGSSGR